MNNSVFQFLFFVLLLLIICTKVEASDPAGRWKGQWVSQSTGHKGPMRAHVREIRQGEYEARFSGRFAVVIPFTYKVTMYASHDAMGNVHLFASKPLGPILGSYSMNATSSGGVFAGTFRAAKDIGAIQMSRVR